MTALLWKEWQEARRPFMGALATLVGLPLFIVLAFRLFYAKEWLFGLGTYIAMALVPVIAATWGAYTLNAEMTPAEGAFLFARPVRPERVVAAKTVIIVPLLMAMLIGPVVLDVLAMFVTQAAARVGDGIPAAKTLLGYAACVVTVFAAAMAAAALLKRLVPAILMGLAAAVLIIIPSVLLSTRQSNSTGQQHGTLLGGLIALFLACLLLHAAALVTRNPERRPISLKPLAWSGALAFLAVTAVVARTIGTNTVIVAELQAPFVGPHTENERVIVRSSSYITRVWAGGNTAYWLSVGSVGQSPLTGAAHVVNAAEFDEDSRMIGAPRAMATIVAETLAGVQTGPSGQSIEYLDARSTAEGAVLGRIPLTDPPASSWRELAVHESNPWGWTSVEDRVFLATFSTDLRRVCLNILDISGEGSESLSETPIGDFYLWVNRIALNSTSVACWTGGVASNQPGRVYRFDCSDPFKPQLEWESSDIPMPAGPASGLLWPDGRWLVEHRDKHIVVVSRSGLWTYALNETHGWDLLGRRFSSPVEIVAGKFPRQIVWKGDRVYEANGDFGMLVYDVSDMRRPRRIAYAGGPAERIAVLDNGLVVVMGLDGSVRVHKLPDRRPNH